MRGARAAVLGTMMLVASGVADAQVFTNLDDAPGAYRIVCRDRASGKSALVSFEKKRQGDEEPGNERKTEK